MNRRLRVAIHISTSTGDQQSSSTEASSNVIIACLREAPDRRVETESTSRLNGRPIRARPSMRARVRQLAAVRGWRFGNPHESGSRAQSAHFGLPPSGPKSERQILMGTELSPSCDPGRVSFALERVGVQRNCWHPPKGDSFKRAKPIPPAILACSVALRVNDAAQFLGIGRSKLYERIRSGRLTAHRPAGRVTLLRADLENFAKLTQVNHDPE
jgi:excisionase family DNA binding protein